MPDLPTTRPFPWKCGHCRERAVQPDIVPYSVEMEHDGRLVMVSVPALRVPRCQKCGQLVLDDEANRQISAALRQQRRLLTPEQIRENREALRLTVGQFAARLGVSEAEVVRWEAGAQIQSTAADRLLRVFFALPDVRAALADDKNLVGLGVPASAP